MSIAEEGTLVADARTRPFDVLPYHEYTAVREYMVLFTCTRLLTDACVYVTKLQPV